MQELERQAHNINLAWRMIGPRVKRTEMDGSTLSRAGGRT